MILDRALHETITWDVTLANQQTEGITGTEVWTEGGALVIKNRGALVVAFGPGAWLEIQRP